MPLDSRNAVQGHLAFVLRMAPTLAKPLTGSGKLRSMRRCRLSLAQNVDLVVDGPTLVHDLYVPDKAFLSCGGMWVEPGLDEQELTHCPAR